MTNEKVTELIEEFDKGRRDDVLQLKVYRALYHFVARGVSEEADDMEDGGFKDEEALSNGVEWLRRKLNAGHLNAY